MSQFLRNPAFQNLSPEKRAEVERLLHLRQMTLARESLPSFAQIVYPRYRLEPFHRLLFETLHAVLRGEIKRLMIFAPPQHGKSLAASVIFPAFWLGYHPDDPIIITSYEATLATAKSYAVRQIVESEAYDAIFPGMTTRRDSRAKNRWLIKGGEGGMRSAGMGGAITGHGAALGIVDDPVKNFEEANSQTIMDKHWNWYQHVFLERVWEHAPIVLIMTRWAENDLAGRLLKSEGASDWSVLRLPALAETQEERDESNKLLGLAAGLPDPLGRQPGEALAPARYSQGYLLQIKRDVGTMAWNAEYQGTPRAPEGNLIKRAWLSTFVDAVPADATHIRYWDKAGTEDGGAATAGVLMAYYDGIFYIEDLVYGHWSAHERNMVMRQTAELDAMRFVEWTPEAKAAHAAPDTLRGYNKVTIWQEQEGGSGGKESAQLTVRDLSKFPIHSETASGDKDTRLRPFIAQAQAGNVRLVRGDWNELYITKMTSITWGTKTNRDIPDATAGAYMKLNMGGFGFGVIEMSAEVDPYGMPLP